VISIGSLCTGYGGLDMAVQEVLGGDLAWVADNDPDAAKVLAHHHPGVLNLGDITAVGWADIPPVDILTAGFPCQSVSTAGRRAGLVAGSASGLWAHVAVAITALRPRLVVIENVGGLRSARADSDVEPCPWCLGDPGDQPHLRALGAVLGDLATLGLHAQWVSLRASDVGAPHPRDRVFILAWPAVARRRGHRTRMGPGRTGMGGRICGRWFRCCRRPRRRTANGQARPSPGGTRLLGEHSCRRRTRRMGRVGCGRFRGPARTGARTTAPD
jgi:DNA (cytosine-5)-methyltransferase 1